MPAHHDSWVAPVARSHQSWSTKPESDTKMTELTVPSDRAEIRHLKVQVGKLWDELDNKYQREEEQEKFPGRVNWPEEFDVDCSSHGDDNPWVHLGEPADAASLGHQEQTAEPSHDMTNGAGHASWPAPSGDRSHQGIWPLEGQQGDTDQWENHGKTAKQGSYRKSSAGLRHDQNDSWHVHAGSDEWSAPTCSSNQRREEAGGLRHEVRLVWKRDKMNVLKLMLAEAARHKRKVCIIANNWGMACALKKQVPSDSLTVLYQPIKGVYPPVPLHDVVINFDLPRA